jgi:hypothetical protein
MRHAAIPMLVLALTSAACATLPTAPTVPEPRSHAARRLVDSCKRAAWENNNDPGDANLRQHLPYYRIKMDLDLNKDLEVLLTPPLEDEHIWNGVTCTFDPHDALPSVVYFIPTERHAK